MRLFDRVRKLVHLLHYWLWKRQKNSGDIVKRFHKHYYDAVFMGEDTWKVSWRGYEILKCPLDLWIMQEIIYQVRPDLLIETGTNRAGSALFFADFMDIIGRGRVVTIDIKCCDVWPEHPRITYVHGSSTDPKVGQRIQDEARNAGCVMVVLDSNHSYAHVLEEIQAYHRLVTPGSYIVVEDTNLNGNPVVPAHGPGPMEAVREFLKHNNDFEVDRSRERLLLTFNPSGYLKRVRPCKPRW